MKIIFYSPHPTHDIVTEVGYATHQRETIIALQQLGAEVIPVVMGGTTYEQVPYKDGKAVEHKGLKALLKKILPGFVWISIKDFLLMRHDRKAAKTLDTAIKLHQPDLVYERSEYLQDGSVAVIKKHKVKYFVEVNAPFVQEMKEMEGSSIWLWLGHTKERRKYLAADIIFCVSTDLKKFISQKYKVSTDKIIVSPNRINKEEFINQAHQNKIPEIHFHYTDAPIIGFVGSILPHHYVEVLIEAFAKVIANGYKVNLLVVGGGSLLNTLINQSREKGMDSLVVFTGKVPHKQVPSYINLMDICVMPGSNWYGSPIKIFEYGILEKAVIAPDNGPVKDVMENLEDGILVKNDVNSLVQAIEKLLSDSELRKRMGVNFKKKIESGYTWKDAAKLILDSVNN